MRILLIWPKGMKQADWAVFPLSLGYLGNSVECSFLDCALDDITDAQLIEHVQGYDLIGVSVWGFNIENARQTIDLIKRNSNVPVVAGGPSAHLANADYTILGEGENSFKKLIDYLSSPNNQEIEKINEISGAKNPIDFSCDFQDDLEHKCLKYSLHYHFSSQISNTPNTASFQFQKAIYSVDVYF